MIAAFLIVPLLILMQGSADHFLRNTVPHNSKQQILKVTLKTALMSCAKRELLTLIPNAICLQH